MKHSGCVTRDSRITDDGLSIVQKLTELKSLSLRNNRKVTDAGLVHLKKLSRLKSVDITSFGVTPVTPVDRRVCVAGPSPRGPGVEGAGRPVPTAWDLPSLLPARSAHRLLRTSTGSPLLRWLSPSFRTSLQEDQGTADTLHSTRGNNVRFLDPRLDEYEKGCDRRP